MMTKKIIWRLKEQPTAETLQRLVTNGILTKEEAREILFNLEEQTDRDIESFKSEIKFLRELIEKLANSQKVVEIIKEVERPYHPYPWYNLYVTWCQNDNKLYCGTSDHPLSTNVNTDKASQNFSDIKTF